MPATDRDTLKALTVLFKSSQHVQDKLKKDMMKQGLNFSEFAVSHYRRRTQIDGPHFPIACCLYRRNIFCPFR
ncbi:MAG: hypothetical protein PWP61_1220 [Trichococcus sp.]|nr:hypothetical protein [Trichococcus sp.]